VKISKELVEKILNVHSKNKYLGIIIVKEKKTFSMESINH
jgi:hypothetical protein